MAASVSVSVEVTLVSRGTSDKRFLITCRTIAMKAVVRINGGLSQMAILNHKSDSEMKTVSFIFISQMIAKRVSKPSKLLIPVDMINQIFNNQKLEITLLCSTF